MLIASHISRPLDLYLIVSESWNAHFQSQTFCQKSKTADNIRPHSIMGWN